MTALVTPAQQVFERGDKIYMVSPVQVFTPSEQQIEEFAFATQVKKTAPNENIIWFRGQYVEADHPNANGAQWRADELAVKSLTPMLMPVTVMHDPRTAVGTIADVKLLTPEADKVPRARIDTVLALWGHRFPEAVNEAQENAQAGTLMQSMECYSPWYECSECGAVFHKLPMGAEKAMWCSHLAASNPSAGYVAQSSNASRILGDVTFTGTGLIYGSRGARGAYSEAHLDSFQDELASYHQTVHTTPSTPRSGTRMGLVQIEDTELAALRKERDDAKVEAAKVPTLTQEKAEAERAAETAEAAKKAAEKERDDAKAEVATANEERAKSETKDKRWNALGGEFVAALGDFTKGRLQEQAASMSDDDWDNRLKELEETAKVKRDAKKDEAGGGTTDTAGRTLLDPPDFKPEEVASLAPAGGGPAKTADRDEQRQVVGQLGGLFRKSA